MDPKLISWLASVKDDPYAFALGAFPWGEPGTVLEHHILDPWQVWVLCAVRDGLLTIDEAIQIAVCSGHGIGKSALVAIIVLWAFSTFPDTLGVVTANTETQLKTKTWAAIGKWFNLCWFMRDHFQLTATALLSRDPSRERTWRIDQVTWSEKNTEAFAGLHNEGKRIILVMDEASAIPDTIWEVAEGALTDAKTQIIWLVCGNPTRSTGRFRECFAGGRFASSWNTRAVDSRTVAITNKKQIQKWIDGYGDDSDFVRIRVKGQFPRTGLMEFFSAAAIEAAMTREVTISITDPLALGCDVARFGVNNSVIFPRKGRDARSIPRKSYNGINTVEFATRIFDTHMELHSDGIFIDGGGVGGGVVDNVRNRHLYCYEVQFGGKDDVGGAVWGIQGELYANKRAAMYGACRAWIEGGALPNDPELKRAMLAIKYTHTTIRGQDCILLESKEDIMDDPANAGLVLDDLDGLVLTFAYPLAAHALAGGDHPKPPVVVFEYDPYSPERMAAA